MVLKLLLPVILELSGNRQEWKQATGPSYLPANIWNPAHLISCAKVSEKIIYPFEWIFLWFILGRRKNALMCHVSPGTSKCQRTSGLRVNQLGREGSHWSVVFANLRGVNTPTMADFRLPTWCHQMWSGAATCIIQSPKPVGKNSSTPLLELAYTTVCRKQNFGKLAGSCFHVTQKTVSQDLSPHNTPGREHLLL